MATDSDKLKAAAEHQYIYQGKQQKEISLMLKVSENTVSKWAQKGNWKALRDAEQNKYKKRVEDIKQVISDLTERRLEITREIKDLRALIPDAETKEDRAAINTSIKMLNVEAVGIGQEVAMYTKALDKMDKDNRLSLATYLDVMDDIFKHLNTYDPALYIKTLDFQESHLQTVTNLLG